MNPRMKALADAGVSIWLDDLSRMRLQSGNLQNLIDEYSVTGVTTNPTIFAPPSPVATSTPPTSPPCRPTRPSPSAIKQLWAKDVEDACDLFKDIYAATKATTAASPSRSPRPGL